MHQGKNILAIYYSQTGQLGDIVSQFLAPLQKENTVDIVNVQPEKAFQFPWNTNDFFCLMPDCVLENGIPLKGINFEQQKYDLIVFGYQPWFLSPSLPATAILDHPLFRKVCENTPVITLIGARNMWLNSQEMVKRKLASSNAILVGNIALTDKGNNLASAVGIVYWLIYGKKESLWGIFPKPGVSDEDIEGVSKYGDLAQNHIISGDWNLYQESVVEQGGAVVKTNLMFVEARAPKLFKIWARIINGRKNRMLWIRIFKIYLFAALFLLSPIVLLVYNLLFVPFTRKSIQNKKEYYLGLSS